MKFKSTSLAVLASLFSGVTLSLGATDAQQDFESSPASPDPAYTTTGTSELNSGAVTGTFSPTGSTWGVDSQTGSQTMTDSKFASTEGTATIKIDNLGINSIPEFSAALLGAFGLLALLRRRR